MKVKLITKYSVEDCINELKKHTKKGFFFFDNALLTLLTFWDNRKYYFDYNEDTSRLERVYYRNIYRPQFVGKIIKQKNSTKIEGSIKTPTSARIFEVFWFSLVGVMGLLFLYGSIRQYLDKGINTESVILIVWPIFMIFMGTIVSKSMKSQGENWKKEMIEFIEVTLSAKLERA